jgi:hypothetical protein
MVIWTFRHMDIRTCCRDAGYGCKHSFENYYRECSKQKNMGNLQVVFDGCHIRCFVLICFVSVDVFSIHILPHYILCLFRRFVHIRFVTLYVLSHYTFWRYTFCCYTFCSLDVLSLIWRQRVTIVTLIFADF